MKSVFAEASIFVDALAYVRSWPVRMQRVPVYMIGTFIDPEHPRTREPHKRQKTYLGAGMVLEAPYSRRLSPAIFTERYWRSKAPLVLCLAFRSESREEILQEATRMLAVLRDAPRRAEPWALMIFVTELLQDSELLQEVVSVFEPLAVDFYIQCSLQMSPELLRELLSHQKILGCIVTTSVSWSDIPPEAQKVFFRQTKSPFEYCGGGFASGKYLGPLVVEWIRQARRVTTKPIVAARCILAAHDIQMLREAGATGVIFDVAYVLRPWNLLRLYARAQKLFLKV